VTGEQRDCRMCTCTGVRWRLMLWKLHHGFWCQHRQNIKPCFRCWNPEPHRNLASALITAPLALYIISVSFEINLFMGNN
jgi:hypothetical protein